MTKPNHTPGPVELKGLQVPEFGPNDLLVELHVEGYGPIAWADGTPQGEETEGNARLFAAAFNSYDKHCGVRAVECAEGDLLGELLEACKLVCAHPVAVDGKPWQACATAIAKAEGSTP